MCFKLLYFNILIFSLWRVYKDVQKLIHTGGMVQI